MFKSLSDREIGLSAILPYIGTWYSWGGDNPDGFDCSGLAIEFLKSVNKFPRSLDGTAQDLWARYKSQRVDKPSRGCLVFWKNSEGKAIHVEVMLNNHLAIGASGGGSKTTTKEAAIKANAFVKVRSIYTRKNILGFIDPFKK